MVRGVAINRADSRTLGEAVRIFDLATRDEFWDSFSTKMPKTSLQKLRETIESSGELTPEHREELRRVAGELEGEVHPIVESGVSETKSAELREAIDVAGELVGRSGDEDDDALTRFETAVEKIAVEHPTVAGFLTALGKLV